MKVLAHDLEPAVFAGLFPGIGADVTVFDQTCDIHACVGCFGCWTKTPSTCVIKDDFRRMGALYDQCEEMIIITNCTYGCYSPFIKNVMDRSINWLLPFIVKRNGEMHHPRRYENRFKLTTYFYGEDVTEAEKHTARRLLEANKVNMDASQATFGFYNNVQELKGVAL